MLIFNSFIPMAFWSRRVRRSPWLAFTIVIFPSIGMWLERFVIIVSSVHRDYLPSSWGMFYPTYVDIFTFTGTFGVFFLLYLLFVRFLPMIAIAKFAPSCRKPIPITRRKFLSRASRTETTMASATWVVPVNAGAVPKTLYGIGAEFAGPKELYAAAEKVHASGYKNWDCYTPYYIHGLDVAIGTGASPSSDFSPSRAA